MAVQCAREASVAHNDALLVILRHRSPSKQNQGDEAVHLPGEYAALSRRPRGERRLESGDACDCAALAEPREKTRPPALLGGIN